MVVTAQPEQADSIASFLIDQGAPGLEIDDAASRVRIIAHFADAAPIAALRRFCESLSEIFPGAQAPDIRVETIGDDDWAENWKAHFPPLAIGERLYLHPPWTAQVPDDRIGVMIDPGMAFGTGHHGSTRGSLVLLERTVRERPVRRVLDIGTGSGVLAIAAAKLGVADVWAVDIDAQACNIAAQNAAVNGVAERIIVRQSMRAIPGQFDLVLANLLANLLIELAEPIADFLHSGGTAVGAGVLPEEADGVVRAWGRAHIRVHTQLEEAGWTTLAGVRT